MDKIDLQVEKLQEDVLLTRAKRIRAEIELEECRGNLIALAEINGREIRLALKIKNNLDSLPYSLAAELAPIDDVSVCEAKIREAIDRACGAIAWMPTKSSSPENESA